MGKRMRRVVPRRPSVAETKSAPQLLQRNPFSKPDKRVRLPQYGEAKCLAGLTLDCGEREGGAKRSIRVGYCSRREPIALSARPMRKHPSAAAGTRRALCGALEDAIEDNGERDDREACFEAHRDVHRIQCPHHWFASPVRPHQRGYHHHGEAQHDALRDPLHDGRQGVR
jgi:hypothetical protein